MTENHYCPKYREQVITGCPVPVGRLTRRLLYSGSENILDEKQKDGKSWRARNSPVRLCPRNDREVSLVMPLNSGAA